ncbi:MAG TPA: hypothetical protein VFD60_09270 [Nitrososphaeraceae archaeon]|jgi:hypothetical protein|nr:hypothetical protein [Nitrososphaeraceae archaeon]
MIDYEFLYDFSKGVLKLDQYIRWVGIANKFGILLNTEHREGLKPFLTEEENEDYASLTVTRHKTRTKFEPKVGKLIYAVGRYQKLNRATIPINDYYYLLIALDIELKNFEEVIMQKVIPLVEKEKNNFIAHDDNALKQ